MTIETRGPRSATPTRGVAVPLPTRREGPAKLTGQALYADDLVFPGAWYGATIRSTVPHGRLLAIELDPAFDWSKVAVVTADDIPGRNVVASIAEDQPILVPVGGEIQHQAEPVALLAAADRETLREARQRVTLRTEALPPVFDPLDVDRRVRPPRAHQGRRRCRDGGGRARDHRGDLPGGPPGAAVHREQRDHRRAARGRRDDRPWQPAVPVLRAQGAARGARPRRRPHPGRPGGDGRRLRRQGGVPVDDRPPRGAAGPQDRTAGADDLRPPRGPVGDDEAASGGDPLPDGDPARRDDRGAGHRPGDGRRRVHDADAGRALAGDDPRGRAIRRRQRPDPLSRRRHQHAAQRGVPRVRGTAGRVRRRDAGLAGRRGHRDVAARGPAPQRLPAGRRHARRTSCCARTRRRSRSSTEPRRPSEFERVRARTAAERAARAPGARTARGHRPGAGLARRRVHGLGRGEDGLGREPRAHGRRPDPDPHGVDRDGPGDEDDLPAAGGGRARDRRRRRRDGAPGHGVRPRLGADGGVADGDGRRRPADRGGAAAQGGGRGPHRPAVRPVLARRRARARRRPDRRAVHALRRAGRSTTRPTAATPTRRSAGRPRSPRWRSTSTRPRSPCCPWSRSTTSGASSTRSCARGRSRAARSRPSATRRSRRSSCSTAATSTTASRRTSSRPRSTPRGSTRSSSRPRSRTRPTAPRASASCRWTSGRRRWSPRSTTRPEPGSTTCPRRPERILAALAGIEGPGAPGVSAISAPAGSGLVTFRLIVNGEPAEVGVPGMRRLLDVLREDLGLTGTKEGCGEGECGACTVLVDGEVVVSCLVPVCQVDGSVVRTVEGLAAAGGRPGGLGDLQDAFLVAGGAQCGICTPGMLMAAEAFLASGAEPTDGAIREAIAGNLCRCTGYTKIVDSIQLAAVRRRRGRGLRPPMPVEPPGRLAPLPRGGVRDPRRRAAPAGRRRHRPARPAHRRDRPGARARRSTCGGVEELRGIRVRDGALEIGALTTYTQIRRSEACAAHAPALVAAAATIGAAQIQNRGTIGGNVMNASPAGDTLPVLLALDAVLVVGAARRRARDPGRRVLAGLPPDGPPRRRAAAARRGSRSSTGAGRRSARSARVGPRRSPRSCWRPPGAATPAGVTSASRSGRSRRRRSAHGPRRRRSRARRRSPASIERGRRRAPRRAPPHRRRPLDRRVPPRGRRADPAADAGGRHVTEIGANRYGKESIRLVKVDRRSETPRGPRPDRRRRARGRLRDLVHGRRQRPGHRDRHHEEHRLRLRARAPDRRDRGVRDRPGAALPRRAPGRERDRLDPGARLASTSSVRAARRRPTPSGEAAARRARRRSSRPGRGRPSSPGSRTSS